jgi:hypothetical protein
MKGTQFCHGVDEVIEIVNAYGVDEVTEIVNAYGVLQASELLAEHPKREYQQDIG